MLARELRGEEIFTLASQIRFLGVPAEPFAGSTLAESGINKRTGCRVSSVEDEAGFTSTIDPQRRFTGDERIVLVGSDGAVQQLQNQFDVAPVEPEA